MYKILLNIAASHMVFGIKLKEIFNWADYIHLFVKYDKVNNTHF